MAFFSMRLEKKALRFVACSCWKSVSMLGEAMLQVACSSSNL